MKQVVSSFLSQFNTPSEPLFDYGHCVDLTVVMEAVYNSCPARNREESERWCKAFLSLFDVPVNLKGVLRARPLFQYWVPKLLDEAGINATGLQQLLDTFLEKLASYPEPNVFMKRPQYVESQLFTYHLTAFGSSSMPCNLYQMWGARLHEGLRTKQKTTKQIETVRWYATSARFFFSHFPHERLTSIPAVITRDVFEAHLALFTSAYSRHIEAARNGAANGDEVAEAHKCRLLSLYDNREVHPNGHQGAGQVSEDNHQRHDQRTPSELLDDRPSTGDCLHNKFGTLKTYVVTEFVQDPDGTTSTTDLMDPDPTVVDFIQELDEAEFLAKPPRLPWHHISRHILQHYPFWWDTTSLPIHALMDLYRAAEALFSDMPRTGAAGLFLITLPYCGRPPAELIDCKIGRVSLENAEQHLTPKNLLIDPWSLIFFYLQDGRRSSFKPTDGTGWLSSRRAISFPVPHPLMSPYARYAEWVQSQISDPEGQRFFQLVDSHGNLRPLTLQDIERIIHSLREKWPHLPTPSALARAFSALFIHGQNFDEVSVRLIDGRFAQSGPQPHYTHRRLLELHEDYQRQAANIHSSVSKTLPLKGWWNDSPDTKERQSPPDGGVGSPLILGSRVFVRDVRRIGDSIKRTGSGKDGQALVRHHNAFVTYTSLFHGILGVRPRNEPNLSRSLFNSPPDILPITDKLSSLYFENRLIGVPSIAAHLYAQLALGRDCLKEACCIYFGSALGGQIPDEQLLFYLHDDGRVRQYSLSADRDMLSTFGAEALASAPLNVGRHLNRTEKVPIFADDVINLHLGHNRAGREALAHHACTFLGQAIGLLRGHHDELLRKLGFESLSYLPGVDRCTKQTKP